MFEFRARNARETPLRDEVASRSSSRAQATNQLLRDCSIELTTNGREAIEAAADVLLPGMTVYVPKLPRQTLNDKLVQIRLLREFGLNPVPHVAARQLASKQELDAFLGAAVAEAGVHRVLVIGGDDPRPCGPFDDSAAVIACGIIRDHGIEVVDVAGYPDGHPRIPDRILDADLALKRRLTREQGLEMNVVTQFSFTPRKIARYASRLAIEIPAVPVYAGMAGPTSPARLMRYAKICGVGQSVKTANSLGMNALRLAMHGSPDGQLEVLSEIKASGQTGNLAGIHLFSFGGFVDSANWIGERIARVA